MTQPGGINRPSEEAADLQIGATDQGMVRIYVVSEAVDLPLDFDPDDADEIAEELMAAARAARVQGAQSPGQSTGKGAKR